MNVGTQRKRVLVVDDDRAIRALLRRGLELRGYDVSEADGAQEAIQINDASPVDLVLTDMLMPDGDGVELIRQLRRKSDRKPAIIAMSGGGQLVDASCLPMSRLFGADRTLSKPFGLAELDETLSSALGDRDAHHSDPAS